MNLFNSELEAVNEILSVSGDLPVTSINSGYEQAEIAYRILQRTSRRVQSRVFWFNELIDIDLPVTTQGEVNTPADALAVKIITERHLNRYIVRGTRVFDRMTNSYSIKKDLKANIVELLDWDLLPETVKQLIVSEAKSVFNTEYYGSQEAQRSIELEIREARDLVQKEDIENREINLLNNTVSSNIAFSNRR